MVCLFSVDLLTKRQTRKNRGKNKSSACNKPSDTGENYISNEDMSINYDLIKFRIFLVWHKVSGLGCEIETRLLIENYFVYTSKIIIYQWFI